MRKLKIMYAPVLYVIFLLLIGTLPVVSLQKENALDEMLGSIEVLLDKIAESKAEFEKLDGNYESKKLIEAENKEIERQLYNQRLEFKKRYDEYKKAEEAERERINATKFKTKAEFERAKQKAIDRLRPIEKRLENEGLELYGKLDSFKKKQDSNKDEISKLKESMAFAKEKIDRLVNEFERILTAKWNEGVDISLDEVLRGYIEKRKYLKNEYNYKLNEQRIQVIKDFMLYRKEKSIEKDIPINRDPRIPPTEEYEDEQIVRANLSLIIEEMVNAKKKRESLTGIDAEKNEALIQDLERKFKEYRKKLAEIESNKFKSKGQ